MIEKEEIKKEIASSVEKYLKDFFEQQRKYIWSLLCKCEPDLNKLLQIQSMAKALDDLEKQILIDKNL